MYIKRNRLLNLLLIFIVIICGLASRWSPDLIPDFLDLYRTYLY